MYWKGLKIDFWRKSEVYRVLSWKVARSQRKRSCIQRSGNKSSKDRDTCFRRFFPITEGENGGSWIDGIVISWLQYDEVTQDEEALWHIRHTDLDEEDLNEKELLQAIDDYNYNAFVIKTN